MSTSRKIDRICIFAVIVALVITILFMNGEALGIQVQAKTLGYEARLFDTSKVHTIDIVIDDWDAFLSTAQSEEYSVCSVVIDGESVSSVGIRGKGNTSLSTVAAMDSDRYSFKIEFDHYDSSKSYYGLDKLSLNNLIQDNTMMKDYLTYQMMNEFGVAAPLCSYAYLTVNGEDWGLYLAVEAVEESFLQRNYGSDYGELYKPDSINMGGGRGNGMDFDFEDFMGTFEDADASGAMQGNANIPQMGMIRPNSTDGSGFSLDEETVKSAFESLGLDTSVLDGVDFENMTMETIQTVISSLDQDTVQKLMQQFMGTASFEKAGGFGGMDMGSEATKLQYIDDDPESYSTIFSSAKTDVTDADEKRLIAALKALSEGDVSALDTEAVLRYFVVHNYVVNADSYTGSMIHNYYLYEADGKLSMIPWDYNLAFGTFQGNQASTAVNDDIDSPLSVTGSDRPMIDWIFASEEYTEKYHAYFAQFLDEVDISAIISQAQTLIAPYVERDPTKFCTYEEFETGVQTLKDFCNLRSQSIAAQLAGEAGNVDASSINLSDMGTMNNGGGGNLGAMPEMGGDRNEMPSGTSPDASENGGMQMPQMPNGQDGMQMPNGQGGMQMPEQSGNGNTPPSADESTDAGQAFSGFGGQGGMTPPNGMGSSDGTNIPNGMGAQDGMGFPNGMGTQDGMGFPDGMDAQDGMGFPDGMDAQDGMNIPDGMELPDGMSTPDGADSAFRGENGGMQGTFPDHAQSGVTSTNGNSQWILLAVTLAILAAGLFVAIKFKR